MQEPVEMEGVLQRGDGLKYLAPARAEAFLGLVRAGEDLDRKLDAELQARHGISMREFEVLLFLAVFSPDGCLAMSQLIERAPLSQSRMSRLVAELHGRGFVERSAAGADGRVVEVSITPEGLELFKAAQETQLAGLERHLFSRISEGEMRRLASITRKILGDGS
jgi:DNA-binding MarR family transcriptional regulator